MSDVTRLLDAVERGDPQAAEELLPLVYKQLRRLAAAKLAREKPGQTLQATALVHEAWLKVAGAGQATWKNRAQFFAVAAEAMRRILIDRARRRKVREKAGFSQKEELEESHLVLSAPLEEVLSIHESLGALEEESTEAATLVKLRYFAGMSMPECAEAMDLPLRRVERIWTFARTWLRADLKSK